MNYRHAFHAGNHGDCLKHALLLVLLDAFKRKDTPFRVLDTHAGRGRYDLTAEEAQRTGEWLRGAGRVQAVTDGPLAPFVQALRAAGFPRAYPGSPALIRAALRPQDFLVAVELHPEDHAALRAEFAGDRQVAVHRRDGYEALRAFTPFPEKRGLLLIDPPFERDDEFENLTAGIVAAHKKFRGGVIAAWYPIKHRAPLRGFHHALIEAGVRDIVSAELFMREPTDPQRLNGSGLLVVNPPYGFEEAARPILAALLDRLGDGEPGQGFLFNRIAAE